MLQSIRERTAIRAVWPPPSALRPHQEELYRFPLRGQEGFAARIGIIILRLHSEDRIPRNTI